MAPALDAFWTVPVYNRSMSSRQERTEDLFVIRIWSEASEDGGSPWRAFVTHTATGSREYFTSYAQLFAFLERFRSERAARG